MGSQNLGRRGFIAGIIAACVAPSIIRTPGLIMPVKPSLITSARDISIGSATLDATGAVSVRIVGRDIHGNRVEEVMRMNNGVGATSTAKFWQIDRADVTTWDQAGFFIKDGLGNHVQPSSHKDIPRRLTESDRATLRGTGWIVPNYKGEDCLVLAQIVPDKKTTVFV